MCHNNSELHRVYMVEQAICIMALMIYEVQLIKLYKAQSRYSFNLQTPIFIGKIKLLGSGATPNVHAHAFRTTCYILGIQKLFRVYVSFVTIRMSTTLIKFNLAINANTAGRN